jgi:RNA recognition motif-containing protein
MLRNLPSSFTRAALLEILQRKGFCGKFDFVYVPVDFASGACLGYAFVNLLDHQTAVMAISSLRGFEEWQGTCSQKTMDACWSDPHQGISMLVERFRNSRVMHGMVPDEYKPALFQDGVRAPFPKNTKRIRPPYSGNVRTKASCA